MNLLSAVRSAGVVGAGGAGFPAHAKLKAQVEWYLGNGAECEPLMHKDRELMIRYAEEVVRGIHLAAEAVGADRSVIGIKEKNADAIRALESVTESSGIPLHYFGDFYPAGDEYELVYEITGRLIPPAGFPPDIGVVVNNVETLYNITKAADGEPVIRKMITVAGAVANPVTTWIPIGMPVADVLEIAGGPLPEDYAVMAGGVMMGSLIEDLDQPVTKTTGGLVVLPADHDLIGRYNKPQKVMDRIGHSACDQCTYCTELCPRYLLGYDVQPHLVMRSLGFSATGPEIWNEHALLCSRCGLCTLYACPEALYPREACERAIDDLRALGRETWEGSEEVRVHPLKNARRIPLQHIVNRIGLANYEAPARFRSNSGECHRVYIPLKQHAGAPSAPVVRTGDSVTQGELIAKIPDGKLGANIHASITGRITEISEDIIGIEA